MITGGIIGYLLQLKKASTTALLAVIQISLISISIIVPSLFQNLQVKADGLPVIPSFTCWESTGTGNNLFYFGYQNANLTETALPLGTDNFFSPLPTFRGQPVVFQPGDHPGVFSVEAGEGSLLEWSLNGSVAATNSNAISQCPAPAVNVNDLKYLNSPVYVLPNSPGSTVATIETIEATSRVAFFIDGDTSSPITLTIDSGPSRPGFELWRLNSPLTAGAHIITAKVFVKGYWFDVPLQGGAVAIDIIDTTFNIPSDEVHIFSSSANPIQVKINDEFDSFDKVEVKIELIGSIISTSIVNRNQCDLSHAGEYVVCNVSNSVGWVPLLEGLYTAKSKAYSKSGAISIETASRPFLVDGSKPVVTSFSIENENSYNTYGSPITLHAQASDMPLSSGLETVNFFVSDVETGQICSGQGDKRLETTGTFDSSQNAYSGTLNVSGLNGKYCINAQAVDKAGNMSVVSSKLITIDTTALTAPTILGWNVKSMPPNNDQEPIDFPCTESGVYISESLNELDEKWTPVIGNNIKYIYRWSVNGGASWEEEVFQQSSFNDWRSLASEGAYITQVRAFDDLNDNNIADDGDSFLSEWSTSCKITLDSSKPTVIEKQAIHSPSSNANLQYSITIQDTSTSYPGNAGDTFSIEFSGPCSSTTQTGGSGDTTLLLNPLSDGTYDDCYIMATDRAGNKSEPLNLRVFVVDNIVPLLSQVERITPIGSDATPLYKIKLSENADLSFGGQCTSATTRGSKGEQSIEFSALPNGTYSTCTITPTDDAGNIGEALLVSPFTIDTVSPVLTLTTAPLNPVVKGVISVQGTVNDLHHGSYSLVIKSGDATVGGPGLIDIRTAPSGVFSFSWGIDTKLYKDGVYRFLLTSTDVAGNVAVRRILEFTIDNTGPTVNQLKSATVSEGSYFSFDISAGDEHATELTIQYRYTNPEGVQITNWVDWGTIPGFETNNAGIYKFFPNLGIVLFDSSAGGAWREGTYEYRYFVKDSIGNYSDSGYSTYNFVDGVNAFYAKYVFKNVPPAVTLNLFTTGQIVEGITDVEFLSSFTDPGFINGLHSAIDPEQDIDFLPPAADAPWYVDVDYGDGSTFTYFDNDDLKLWKPGDISIPNHIYKKDGIYTVTVTVSESSEASGEFSMGSGEQGIAQLKVTVGNLPPVVQIMPGVAHGTLFAYISGGNAPFTFAWGGACSGNGQSTQYPTETGTYSCVAEVVDADGDQVIRSFDFSIISPSQQPVIINSQGQITPEAAYTESGTVLGTSVKSGKESNSYDIEANSGSSITLQGARGMCSSFGQITFRTITAVKGKVFIYQHNKDGYAHLPFGDSNLTVDVCEIVIDGFKSTDISNIVLDTKVEISWLEKNGLSIGDLVLYTASEKENPFNVKKNLARSGEDAHGVINVRSELTSLPVVYAIAPDHEKKQKQWPINWWILGISGFAALSASGFMLLRKRTA